MLEASTLVHGGSEDLKAIVLDLWGDVIVAGDSSGSGYPVTPGAVQPDHMGGDDLVLSRLTPDLTGPHIELVPSTVDFGHLPVGMEGRQVDPGGFRCLQDRKPLYYSTVVRGMFL